MPKDPGQVLTRKLEALWRKADEKNAWNTVRKLRTLLGEGDPPEVELEALGYLEAIVALCERTHGRIPETAHEPKPS